MKILNYNKNSYIPNIKGPVCSIFRNLSEPMIGLSILGYCNMAVQHCGLYGRVPTLSVDITGFLLGNEKQFFAIRRHLKRDEFI